MRRHCLDCHTLIDAGTRCARCTIARRRQRGIERGAQARGSLPQRVKARDGRRCTRCGSTEQLEAHHIIPRSQGGPDTLDNLVTLCHACHAALHRASDSAERATR